MKLTEIHIIPSAEVDEHSPTPDCVCAPSLRSQKGKCTTFEHHSMYEDTPDEFTLNIQHRKPKAK